MTNFKFWGNLLHIRQSLVPKFWRFPAKGRAFPIKSGHSHKVDRRPPHFLQQGSPQFPSRRSNPHEKWAFFSFLFFGGKRSNGASQKAMPPPEEERVRALNPKHCFPPFLFFFPFISRMPLLGLGTTCFLLPKNNPNSFPPVPLKTQRTAFFSRKIRGAREVKMGKEGGGGGAAYKKAADCRVRCCLLLPPRPPLGNGTD